MAQPQAPKGYIPVNDDGEVEVYIYQPTDPRIKSPSWYIYYYYSQKIYRQSLKTKNQKAAHRLARETAEKLTAARGPSSIRYEPTAMPPSPTWSNAPSPSIRNGPTPPGFVSKPR